ncbi:MAG TPA: methylated-DNA--[protein]-cysteine S-methyltransferase [Methylomirabilota bacterium]|jgi:methylated-DNA-[protein]-cysteine S-methyltransferase|nr:methylated-DNA--[protein]-cysteine S-methyltransferase [Methylomirabilota bacterium]
MTAKPRVCLEIGTDLIAVATGEASATATRRVEEHVDRCAPCRRDFHGYRAVEGVVGALRATAAPDADAERARAGLESRLADLRTRIVRYGIFGSPLGRILIGISEQGVAAVEYLPAGAGFKGSRLSHLPGVEAQEDGAQVEALHRELAEYLGSRRTRLDWPLDLRLARSDFHRKVLRATAAVPYGAVTSYAGIAEEIGAPKAVRAVAQALRWNPVPIVVPCHRIVGSEGSLTGYAGPRIDLKARLLGLEGVPTEQKRVARATMYHLDRGEDAYCLPTCGTIATRPIGRVTLFGSRERAEAVGLQPCTACRPDLHPLPR